ncbi:MAG: magnesium/cobalt transporter CorA [candidate division KSB1 bacterium]|nr:magnesium/cobalt transporter CorA [candidate division KSB1 bacterium]
MPKSPEKNHQPLSTNKPEKTSRGFSRPRPSVRRLYHRGEKKAGVPPGTLIHVGEKKAEQVRISLLDYDRERYLEKELAIIEAALPYKDKPTVTWINLDGIHQVDILENIGQRFGIHPLALEDILNTAQRPKVEDYGDYIFIVLKMLSYNERSRTTEGEQISIVLGSTYVLSFQEKTGDIFDLIRERIRNNESGLRKNGPDYLVYRLLDTIVDHYFLILEKLGEEIEEVEEELMKNPAKETLTTLHHLKREMIFLRKSIWPLREIISKLEREESPLIKSATGIFLRDVYDHTIQVIDTVENFRDMLAGMLDIYLSSLSNKMNEVMKVLTIIATIFIPLTFIAGIYGMNFNTERSPWNMPELNWYFGYPAIMAIMTIIGLAMVIYFKQKKWF